LVVPRELIKEVLRPPQVIRESAGSRPGSGHQGISRIKACLGSSENQQDQGLPRVIRESAGSRPASGHQRIMQQDQGLPQVIRESCSRIKAWLRSSENQQDQGLPQAIRESAGSRPASGHQRISRIKASLGERFFRYRMMKKVAGFVSTCGLYNRNKHPQHHTRAEMIKYHTGAPMERVNLDFLGPLPKT
jgi:hypothetical protein